MKNINVNFLKKIKKNFYKFAFNYLFLEAEFDKDIRNSIFDNCIL